MLNSPQLQSRSLLNFQPDDPYALLRSYVNTAKVKSKAYGYSEGYFRWLYKVFTYPLVILSAMGSILAGLDVDKHVLMGISVATLILTGFNQAINPKSKEKSANQMSVEMNEIASNCKQFIYSNNRTAVEIKAFSEIIHEQLNIWNSLAPPIQDKFLTKALKECAKRSRKHNHSLQKKKTIDITIQ